MMAPAPIHTFRPRRMGFAYSMSAARSAGSTGCVAVQSWTPGPSFVSSPISTAAQSRTRQRKFRYAPSPNEMFEP
jgi:hypothetical protein